MAVTPTASQRRHVAQPEPGLTAAEVVARAEEIAPTLVARQAETEERTYYAPDTHELFREAGFYRILVPRRYGGYEFGIDTFMRVTQTLTRACPSTGWMYCLGSAHALAVGSLFPERAQDELFGDGEFVCPATVAPTGTATRTSDGDWHLNGVWKYCSGSPYATHFMGHALVAPPDGGEPAPMLFVAPRDQWRRLDDWGQQLGLRGSGSHSIAIDDGRVPDHFTLPQHFSQVDASTGLPGRALHDNPEYGGGQLSFMVIEDAILAVGIAQSALDAYGETLPSRSTIFPPIMPAVEDPDYQLWYGKAAGLIATAEAATQRTIERWHDLCVEGPAAVTKEQELHIGAVCHEVVGICWRAIERYLQPKAGSSAVSHGERFERVWRDMSMMHTHAGVSVYLAAIAKRELARLRFGIEE
jgi:3-hydroxy-9,10-secoandrosta-1,3,5(10)-triene-9,17-dione monooxygenase